MYEFRVNVLCWLKRSPEEPDSNDDAPQTGDAGTDDSAHGTHGGTSGNTDMDIDKNSTLLKVGQNITILIEKVHCKSHTLEKGKLYILFLEKKMEMNTTVFMIVNVNAQSGAIPEPTDKNDWGCVPWDRRWHERGTRWGVSWWYQDTMLRGRCWWEGLQPGCVREGDRGVNDHGNRVGGYSLLRSLLLAQYNVMLSHFAGCNFGDKIIHNYSATHIIIFYVYKNFQFDNNMNTGNNCC